MTKCNLGKVKHETMLASGLYHYLCVGQFLGFSRALVILQRYRRSQTFCSPCSFGSSLICFLPPPLPPLWMLFWVSICTFFRRGSHVTVPGGCRSQGCHGYLLGSPVAPFCFTRQLPCTYLLLMGLNGKLIIC